MVAGAASSTAPTILIFRTSLAGPSPRSGAPWRPCSRSPPTPRLSSAGFGRGAGDPEARLHDRGLPHLLPLRLGRGRTARVLPGPAGGIPAGVWETDKGNRPSWERASRENDRHQSRSLRGAVGAAVPKGTTCRGRSAPSPDAGPLRRRWPLSPCPVAGVP